MNRQKRLEVLEEFLRLMNEGVADLPKNINRFSIEAFPAPRGYGVLFYFRDRGTEKSLPDIRPYLCHRWYPVRARNRAILYPPDVIDEFNKFVIGRREY